MRRVPIDIDEARSADEALRLLFIDPPRAESLAREIVSNLTQSDRSRAVAYLALSRVELQRGSLPEAKSHLDRATQLSVDAGDPALDASIRLATSTLAMAEGDLVFARKLADDVLAINTLSDTDRGRALFQRALVRHRQGETGGALDDFHLAEQFLKLAEPIHLVRMLLNRSVALSYRHQFEAAEADVRRAEALATENGLLLQRALCQQNLGFVAAQRGDLITALHHYDEALVQLEDCGANTSVVAADRGAALSAAGLFREAKRELFRALDNLTSRGFAIDEAETRLLVAQLASATDDHDQARDQALLARDLFRIQDRETWALAAEAEFLRSLFRSSASDRSEPDADDLASRALQLISRLEAAGWSALAWAIRGAATIWLDHAGRTDEVAALFSDTGGSLDTAQPFLTDLARGEANIHYARVQRSAFTARQVYWSSIATFDRHRATSGSAELRARAASLAGGLVSAAIAVEEQFGSMDEALQMLDAYRDSTLRLWPLVNIDQPSRAEDETVVATERKRSRIDGHVAGRERATLQQVDEVLNTSMALLFHVHHGRVEVYVRRLSETRRFDVGPLEVIVDAIDRITSLFTLSCGTDTRSLRLRRRFDAEASELSDVLFGPVIAAWPGEQSVGVISPDSALSGVLWGAIHPDEWTTAAIAPSLSAWWRASTAAHTPIDSTNGRVIRSFIAGPGLPGADREVHELADAFGGTVLHADDANVMSVTELVSRSRFVHIAAHGVFRDDHPLLSGLVLQDRVMHGYDVDRISRTPETVVLSACDGANEDGSPGTHLGLATVFLARGTLSVLGALAPIPDAITVEVMKELYCDPSAGLLAALHRARRDPRLEVAHAAQAFVVIGTGGFF